MIELPALKTERLWLRALRSTDAADLHIAFSDPECMRWSHRYATSSLDESAKVVAEMLKNDAGQWAFGLHGTETVLGHVGFVTNLRPGGHAGFGYALRRSEWGQGYATEAATVALGYGFDDVGIARAELWIHRVNVRSIRVAEKLGCERRAETYLNYEVGPTPSLIYGITAEQWRLEVEPPPVHYTVSPILKVSDVAVSVDWWQKSLGFHVGFIHGDPPTVASVIVHPPWAGNASIQLRQSEYANVGQGAVYVMVGPGIDALAERAISTGAEVISALAERPWGMREMDLRDPDGNTVRIGSPSDGSRFRSN